MFVRLFLPMVGKTDVFQIIAEIKPRFLCGVGDLFFGKDGEAVGLFNAVIAVSLIAADKGGVVKVSRHFFFVQLGVPEKVIIAVTVVEIAAVVEIVKIIAFLPGKDEISAVFQGAASAPQKRGGVFDTFQMMQNQSREPRSCSLPCG